MNYKICKNCGRFYNIDYCPLCDKPNRKSFGKSIKHHLLEYYFTAEQLKELRLYYNVPMNHILIVDGAKHFATINGLKLHEYLYKDNFDYWVEHINDEQINHLLEQIPKILIDTFKK